MKGYIYVLTNPAFPEWVKIGRTTNEPWKRASELSSTGVPHPFEVAFSMEVTNCVKAEEWLHKKFRNYRVTNNREFFEITPKQVEEKLREHISPGSVARRGEEARAERESKKQQQHHNDLLKQASNDWAQQLRYEQGQRENGYGNKWGAYFFAAICGLIFFVSLGGGGIGVVLSAGIGGFFWWCGHMSAKKDEENEHISLVRTAELIGRKYSTAVAESIIPAEVTAIIKKNRFPTEVSKNINKRKDNLSEKIICGKCGEKLDAPIGKRTLLACPICQIQFRIKTSNKL